MKPLFTKACSKCKITYEAKSIVILKHIFPLVFEDGQLKRTVEGNVCIKCRQEPETPQGFYKLNNRMNYQLMKRGNK